MNGMEEPSFTEIEDGSRLCKPVLLGELPRHPTRAHRAGTTNLKRVQHLPELIDRPSSEGRNRVYKMLNLKVEAFPDAPLRLTGPVGDGSAFPGQFLSHVTLHRSRLS